MGKKCLFSQKGFSLVELLTVMALTVIVGAAAVSTYSNFVSNSTRESALNALNIDTKIALKLLENDIQMAGFGLPIAARAASDQKCNYNDDSFCKKDTDRLFLADGTQMLTDITDNGENDGNIPTSPTDYASIITLTKNNGGQPNGGYYASLTNATNTGDTSLTVNTLNIDSGQENLNQYNGSILLNNTPSDDFIANQALIITDSTATPDMKVEGHIIASISGTTLDLAANEAISGPISGSYGAGSQVVPAVAWYVIKDPDGKTYPDGSTMYWLYRNQNKVIPNVDNFQVTYGYYDPSSGMVWDIPPGPPPGPPSGTIPPSTAITTPPTAYPFLQQFDLTGGASGKSLNSLKAIQITLTTKFVYKGTTQLTTYKTIVALRN